MPQFFHIPELLAPAGNATMLHAVISAGADAAYLGMGELNARRSAENFDDVSFRAACDYAHLRGARIYVTMNTIVLPDEMERAVTTARRCFESGADAFIVQDLGLAVALRQQLPDARLHASTQMSTHSKDGIAALAELGFSRVTLARELSFEEIFELAEFAKSCGMEVETFAHGALCVCYSGQCLMSSMIGGRSANRGLCAQACRLPYRLVDERDPKRQLKSPGEHLLSPKDLCLVDDVDKLASAGVASLKIEGRMKSPEYAHTVTSVYREALDAYRGEAEGNGVAPEQRDEFATRLGSVFSRGFTKAYFDGKRGNDIMSYQRPNNRGQFVGRVKQAGDDFLEVACDEALAEGDLLEVWTRRGNFTVKVETPVKVSGKVIRLFSEDVSRARANDRVFRVRSADAAYIDDDREPRVPVAGKVQLRIGRPLKVSFEVAEDGSFVARRLKEAFLYDMPRVEAEGDVVEAARTRAVTADDVAEHIDRLGQTPYRIVSLEVDLDDNVGIGFSALHHIRSDALDSLTQAILQREGLNPSQSSFRAKATKSPESRNLAAAEGRSLYKRDFRIAVIATNPESARAAKRAGANDILVPALNYKRGQAQYDGVLEPEPTQTPYPKKCTIMIPAIAHDGVGESREAALGEDVWSNVAPGQQIYVESLAAIHHAEAAGCPFEIGAGLPLVNVQALSLADALGANRVWLSPELNLQQIEELASSQKSLAQEQGAPARLGVKVAGAQELMTCEHCMLMSQGDCSQACIMCTRRRVPHTLEDRKGYRFPVVTDALGRSHIYNSVELDNVPSLPDLARAGITDFLIDATLMTPEQTAQATGRLAKALQVFQEDGNALSKLPNATTGHLHRGVR